MRVLVICEHDGQSLLRSTRSAISFARSIATATSGDVTCLLIGTELDEVAQDAVKYEHVLVADHPALEHPLADRRACMIAKVTRDEQFDLLVAASNTTGKDIVSRAAGLLGGSMASDVISHEYTDGQLFMQRPMYAGAITATVSLLREPRIVTVRPSAYELADPADELHELVDISVREDDLPKHIQFESIDSKQTGRPDVAEARVVVSGGRALKSSDDFELIVGGLADALGGATGSSRALVDAGIAPNEMQVGQTGKIVAPDLYIALGISGAIQHLAGMKNSKVIVAINSDAEAPIFEVADYGLVRDVYQVVPELIEKLNAS